MEQLHIFNGKSKRSSGGFVGRGRMVIKPLSIPDDQRAKLIKAILKNVIITITGCWEWTGRIHQHKKLKGKPGYKGHPSVSAGSSSMWAHRASYALFVGPIAENKHIDHKCRNTVCINPAHLQQLTPQENYQAIYRRKRRDEWRKLNERQLQLFETNISRYVS